MNNFERRGNPLEKIGIGGLSFDTLKVGAILESQRFFGVSKSTGIIRGYTSSAIKISRGNYLLITEVRNKESQKKNISWRKYPSLLKALEQREILRTSGKNSLQWYGIPQGFFDELTKRRFDYRLKVVEAGFNES